MVIEVLDYNESLDDVNNHNHTPKPVTIVKQVKSSIELRDYQNSAYESVMKDLETTQSALVVMATGLG